MITIARIMAQVCSQTGYTVVALQGASRLDELVAARKLVITEAIAAGYSQTAIGRALNRHPSSIHYMIHIRRSPMAKKPAPPPKEPPTDWTNYAYSRPKVAKREAPEQNRVTVTGGGDELESWQVSGPPIRGLFQTWKLWRLRAGGGAISRLGLDAVTIKCGALKVRVPAHLGAQR